MPHIEVYDRTAKAIVKCATHAINCRVRVTVSCLRCDAEDYTEYSLKEFLDELDITLDDCKEAFGVTE